MEYNISVFFIMVSEFAEVLLGKFFFFIFIWFFWWCLTVQWICWIL